MYSYTIVDFRRHLGRSVNLNTKLGRLLHQRGIPTYQLAAFIPVNTRQITEYTSGRKPIPEWQLNRMVEFFHVDKKDLVEWGGCEIANCQIEGEHIHEVVMAGHILPPKVKLQQDSTSPSTLLNPKTLAKQHLNTHKDNQ